MEDIMLTVRLNARFSTSVQLMELVVLPSTVSSAPTEPSSTRTTSSVTGGLTLTVLRLRVCTVSMTSTLLSVMLWLTMLLPLLLKDMLPLLNTKVLDAVQADRDLSEDVTTTEGDSKSER